MNDRVLLVNEHETLLQQSEHIKERMSVKQCIDRASQPWMPFLDHIPLVWASAKYDT